ncbi:hypothetical protein KSP40_PGU022126 [Platanthera guangdongensis]|uniref:C2H2-type domain-containing protein n=1 Tax=Platanthera guangdongensis TaxID=2320717 RepID=A0ABR2LWV3_9ASPA
MGGDVPAKQRRRKTEKEKKKTPITVWDSLKKSLPCSPEQSEVCVPVSRTRHSSSVLSRRRPICLSGCSRSIANLRDVIHGSKRHMERPPICSPRSIGSSEFLNPVTHEAILTNSKPDLKITGFVGGPLRGAGSLITPPRISRTGSFAGPLLGNNGGDSATKLSLLSDSTGITCHKCGERVMKEADLEAHHLSKHAVTELMPGDSSRKIIEMICRTNPIKTEGNCWRIARILKVQNTQKTLARFEEHREMVKLKAEKLPKKHPRCLADGNELLRFHGTKIACNLGMNGSSSPCASEKCSACRILRHGLSAEKEMKRSVGVFTASTSGRALESVDEGDGCDDEDSSVKKALLVCRVIAGRVHRPLENLEEIVGQSGFDSVAGKVGLHSNIEELYLLNPRALLPCFVVICKS